MTVVYCGNLSIGEAMPGAAALGIAGALGINLALPDIQARLDALLAFAPLDVNFAAQLALALQVVASIQATITAGITPPSLSIQIALVLALVAELQASLLSITAQLDIIVDFQALLLNAGVHAYAYSGDAGDFGDELDTELATGLPGGGGAGESVDAIVLVTNVGATWTALSQILQVTP